MVRESNRRIVLGEKEDYIGCCKREKKDMCFKRRSIMGWMIPSHATPQAGVYHDQLARESMGTH